MLEWLKQRVISWFLSRHVGRWIAVDPSNLHGETHSDVWTLVAKNLAVKTDCLDGCDNIPFRVRSGTVKKLTVLWRKEHSVSLVIDTVSVVLESHAQNALTPEQRRQVEKNAKQQLLEQWELRLDDNLTPQQVATNSPSTKDGEESNVTYRALLDKLEITISRIDFVYHDSSGTLGAHIDTIALENHQPSQSCDLLEHTIKSANISGFSLFIDAADGQAPAGEPSALPLEKRMQEQRERSYLLHPCTASVRIGYDSPKAKFDLARPRISLIATIPELQLKLRREQLLCVVKVMDLFDIKRRKNLSRPGRPLSSALEDPRAWWRYVQTIVVQDVRDRKLRRTGAYLAERRRRRVRYVDLYLRHRAGSMQANEVKEMEALEDSLGFNDIVFFRCTAIREQQQRSGKLVRREQKPRDANKTSWSFAGWSWATSASSKGAEAASGAAAASVQCVPGESGEAVGAGGDAEKGDNNESNPFQRFTSEEREALLSALDFGGSEVGATYTSLMQSQNPEQQLYNIAISLGSCSGCLLDPGKLSVRASFNDATVKVTGRVQAVAWHGELLSLSVVDLLGQRPLCKQNIADGNEDLADGKGANRASDLLSVDWTRDGSSSSTSAPPRTSVRVRVAALDVTADPIFLFSFAAFWEVHHASRYERANTLRPASAPAASSGTRNTGTQRSSVLALGRDELLSLDVDVDAPNIYICENGSMGFSGSVLMLRLGHFSIRNAPNQIQVPQASVSKGGEDGEGGPPQAAAVNCSNRYLVQVENVGVDLLQHAEVQEDEVYCESTIAIVNDTRLRASIDTSILLQPGGGTLRDTVSIDAALPSLSVRVSEENLLDVARIIASWSQNRKTLVSYQGEQASVKGWVLIQGVASQSGWCWRWVTLKQSTIELFREEDGTVLDQMFVLDAVQVSSEHYKGLWVISLQQLQDDDGSDSSLLMYAAAQHSTFLASIWHAQKEFDPSRDWSATVVKPNVVLDASAEKVTEKSVRCLVSFRVGMLRSTLLQDGATAMDPLLDLRVNDLSGTVHADDTKVSTHAQVSKIDITGNGKQCAAVPYKLLSLRPCEETSSPPDSLSAVPPEGEEELPCFSMQATSIPGQAAVCHIQMPKAVTISIDPRTVEELSTLQARVLDVWRNLRKNVTSGVQVTPAPDKVSGSEPDTEGHYATFLLSPSTPAYFTPEQSPVAASPSSSMSWANLLSAKKSYGTSLVLSGIETVPDQFLTEENKSKDTAVRNARMSTTLTAVGMHVLLIDERYHELMLLKMQTANLVKTNFQDGSTALSGTLGKLEVLDLSASTSLHPKFMTVSEDANSLVKVDVELFDDTSVDIRENLWQVRIFRPRITVLWRFVSDVLQYQRSFYPDKRSETEKTVPVSVSSTNVPAEETCRTMSSIRGPTIPTTRGPTLRGAVVNINLDHPELILPRSSTSNDAFHADLGRVDINRASRHSSDRWSVAFKNTHLETVHTSSKGKTVELPCVRDVDGTAHLRFCRADADDAEAEMSVDVELDRLRGSITDSQYALILSIFGENFTEMRECEVESASPYKALKSQMSHVGENDLSDTLRGLIDLARGLNAHRVPSSLYNVMMRNVELDFYCSKPSCSEGEISSLLRAKAADLKVRYEGFAKIDTVDGGKSQGLDSSCTAQLSQFELFDTRDGAVQKSEPLFRVRQPPRRQNLAQERADEEEIHVLFQYFKLSQGHTGIYSVVPNVDTVFDIGLLMNAISFLGTSNGPAQDTEEFRYVKTRTGGFRVQFDMPRSRMQFLTRFDRADAMGFDMSGFLSVTYASSASCDVLDVKVDDLKLKTNEMCSGSGSHDMEIVRPCSAMASWQWYRDLDLPTREKMTEFLKTETERISSFFFAANDLRAFVTYENVMLAMRVYYCLINTLSASKDSAEAQSPVSQDPLQTPKNAPDKQVLTRLKMSGANIMLTLIDDFDGRWIPLVRLVLPNMQSTFGDSSAIDFQLIRARLDYFHAPSSSWQEAVVGEPTRDGAEAVEGADLWVHYKDGVKDGCRDVQIAVASQDALVAHVSRAAIDSCLNALQAWSQDRRTWGNEISGLSRSSSPNLLTQSQVSYSHGTSCFVPYTVQNTLAETLLVITDDGSEYRVESQHWVELSYAQVFGRCSELSKYARDWNDAEIKNTVHLQLAAARRIFGRVSIEKEITTSFDIEAPDVETGTPALRVCSQLYRKDGQKFLRIMSMVSIRNCADVPLVSGILGSEDAAPVQLGIVPVNGMIGIPLHLARDGILIFKPIVSGLEYDWCDVRTEAIRLSTLHDGSFRVTQMVDVKFQRLFGASLPADTSLLHWYACANDLPGVGMRQGVLYITNWFLCHHSSIMGDVIKEVIPISAITNLKKVNTALVIPNAIRVTTQKRTYYFRSFTNRAQTFREIVKLLPDTAVVSEEDDVDLRTRTIFDLEPSDTILSMYSALWHHDPGITEGKVLLTRRHLLFISNDESVRSRRKIAWKNVQNIEKRKSFLVRNNAVNIIGDTEGNSIFLSSGKWDRNKVVDEEMSVLWQGAHGRQETLGIDSSGSLDQLSEASFPFADSGVRCRTLTCNVIEAMRTPRAGVASVQFSNASAPGRTNTDARLEYERQLQRSRDAVTFTVSVLDCKTQGRGVDRKAGNPCVIELHAPWVLENLTCCTLEVQIVDKTKSVIARVEVSPGALRQITSVDLRRELRLRTRIVNLGPVGNGPQCGLWSPLVPIYSAEHGETDNALDVPNINKDEGSQEIMVEVAQDPASCGFRMCLYNKFWVLNLTGLDLCARYLPFDPEHGSPRILPPGSPMGWGKGDGLEIQVPGYEWSSEFCVADQSECVTMTLVATGSMEYENIGGDRSARLVDIEELDLEVSTSAGVGRFDRTIVITIAPIIVVENCLPDASILVWQRSTPALPYLEVRGPRISLAAGETCPFHPEGIRKYCRLSLNLKEDGAKDTCASFAPEIWWRKEEDGFEGAEGGDISEPILLRLSSGRLVTLSSSVNRTNTVVLKVSDPRTVLHSICNRSYFSLEFRQVEDEQKRIVHVEPWTEEPLVWPEPTDLPHKLVLAKINGIPLARSAELDLQSSDTSDKKVFDEMAMEDNLRRNFEVASKNYALGHLSMGTTMSAATGEGSGCTAMMKHDGKWLKATVCQNGANMWCDRDGACDKRRNYRLRNIPHLLEDCTLFQLPCRLSPNSAVEVSVMQAATVYVFFVPPPRDGGLPAKLLANRWKQEKIPGVYGWFDWDGKVGNPERDRFVTLLSKTFSSATTFILPSHAGETLMGIAVRGAQSPVSAEQEQAPNAGQSPDGISRCQLPGWRGSRYVLRLHDPDLKRGIGAKDPQNAGTPPLVIQLTGSKVALVGASSNVEFHSDVADTTTVALDDFDPHCSCFLRPASQGEGWVLEKSADGRGSDTVDLFLNNAVLTDSVVLQHGDAITLASSAKAKARGAGGGIVYVFEDFFVLQKQFLHQAASLRVTTGLDQKCTKIMHIHVGELIGTTVGPRIRTSQTLRSFYSIKAPVLKFILEDDIVSMKEEILTKEEVLFLSMDDISMTVETDRDTRTFNATILGIQVDNQFDDATKFPVVLSVMPSDKAALNMTMVESGRTNNLHTSYEIHFGIGEAFFFLDDKLIVRVGAFLSKVLPQKGPSEGDDKSRESLLLTDGSRLPPSVNSWEILVEGVEDQISELHMLVVKNKRDSRARVRSDSLLFVTALKVRSMRVHLTLMSTGQAGSGRGGRGGGAAVVRKYAGAVLERMIRQVRIDDVIVDVPEQNLSELRITQSGIVTLISSTLLRSLKKSFFSAKFALKGLDAWTDSILGLETQGQMAGKRQLTRIPRRIPLANEYIILDGEDSQLAYSSYHANTGAGAALSSRRVRDIGVKLGGRAITTLASVPQFAGGMVKQTLKKGVSVADKGVRAAGEALRQSDVTSIGGRPSFRTMGTM